MDGPPRAAASCTLHYAARIMAQPPPPDRAGDRPLAARLLRQRAAAFVALIACAGVPPGLAEARPAATSTPIAVNGCAVPARGWHLPGRPVGTAPYGEALAHAAILLGERHDSAEHHRWQLQVLAALHAQRPELAIGLEMFPRRVQPVLDRWVAGELQEAEFLRLSDWQRVWGFDPALYLPILHFARLNRIPLLALNVERSLVRAVAAGGWETVPVDQREGLSRPAPAPERQLARLREIHAAHPPAPGAPSAVPEAVRFRRFVEAQLVWDRAMAEGIADRLRSRPGALVVALMGSEHARRDQGVGQQLLAMGQPPPYVMMPIDREPGPACPSAGADGAHAWFVIPATGRPVAERPRLGVSLDTRERAVVVTAVAPGSLAARHGLRAGDRLVSVAGRPLEDASALVAAVREQPPGTLLPMTVVREGRETEVLVRFPPASP